MLKRVAIFADADELSGPDELAAAHRVGRLLGENGITLVYDGSSLGSAGAAAEAAVRAGGRLVGIALVGGAPGRADLAERREVATIEAWRAELAASADAVVALPGGFASLEAAFDVWTWSGPSARERPLGLYDAGEYYSRLLRTASDAAVDRFVQESQRGLLVVSTDAEDLLRRLADYRPPETRRDSPFDDD